MAKSVATPRDTVTAIKELILARGLHPGDPIPTEAELVTELKVSRSSVREAVRNLVALDILEVRHGFGTFVGKLSMSPFVEAMVFRGMLQPGANNDLLRQVVQVRQGLDLSLAPLIVGSVPDDTAAQLREHVESMQAAARRQESFAHDDRAFHMLMSQAVANDLYGQMVAAFWDIHTLMAPRLGAGYQRELTETAFAHAALLEAAMTGDLEGYREAVVKHYEHILRAIGAAPDTPPHGK